MGPKLESAAVIGLLWCYQKEFHKIFNWLEFYSSSLGRNTQTGSALRLNGLRAVLASVALFCW